MIVNYNVRIKNVKVDRLNRFINYLNDNNHKNHTKKNTEIYELSEREIFTKIANSKIKQNRLGYMKNGKGGRPLQVFGKSLTFNIPVGFEFDLEKSNLIYEDLINGIQELYKHIPPLSKEDNVESYEIDRNEIYGVLHKQENSHYHIVLPYIDKNGKTLRGIKSPTFLNECKLLWNIVMEKHYNTSINDYTPKNEEEQNKSDNRRYLEDLKRVYENKLSTMDNLREMKYLSNQVKVIDRLLKLNEEDLLLEEDRLTTIENNYKKTKTFYKGLEEVVRPTSSSSPKR